MAVVIDASLVAAWLLPDERDAAKEATLKRIMRDGARVPTLFWHELRNVLLSAERRGRIPVGEADRSPDRARRLPIVEVATADDATLSLARRHRLTAYDAAYLALSLAEALPLASVDRALIQAARVEGVSVVA